MKLGSKQSCQHCKTPVLVCQARGGRWLPFNLALVEYTAGMPDVFVPVTGPDQVVALVPVNDVADRRLQGVKWAAQQHRCTAYLRNKAATRAHVEGLDVALLDWLEKATSTS